MEPELPYQTFEENKKGFSDSLGKWNSLKIEDKLFGKKVLDLGCNEGFFCIKCSQHGAQKVIGIDRNEEMINSANQRKGDMDNIEFINCDWSHLDNWKPESFDVILLLTAMHYSSGPDDLLPNGTNKILNQVVKLLKKGGLLVFEGGVIISEEEEWVARERAECIGYHPTQKKFEKICSLLFDKVELIGKSVNQLLDPFDHYVYHCVK